MNTTTQIELTEYEREVFDSFLSFLAHTEKLEGGLPRNTIEFVGKGLALREAVRVEALQAMARKYRKLAKGWRELDLREYDRAWAIVFAIEIALATR